MTDPTIEVPHRFVTIDHATLVATCSHPHRVGFQAGYHHTDLIVINGVTYKLALTVRHDDPTNPAGRWRIDSAATWRTLHRPDGRDTTDAARQVLHDAILPQLLRWLTTPDAVALRTEGAHHRRATITARIDNAEQHLRAALGHLDELRRRIATGEDPTDDEADYASRAATLTI